MPGRVRTGGTGGRCKIRTMSLLLLRICGVTFIAVEPHRESSIGRLKIRAILICERSLLRAIYVARRCEFCVVNLM